MDDCTKSCKFGNAFGVTRFVVSHELLRSSCCHNRYHHRNHNSNIIQLRNECMQHTSIFQFHFSENIKLQFNTIIRDS